ncbi:Protein FAR1-RELATED SEQUENCE 3 [Hordeum vulgare]|nr:Protein FAR1-RELATED SEQUENCE 3 [Hordeum vulgare]
MERPALTPLLPIQYVLPWICSLDPIASDPVCSAHPGESQASMSIAVGEEIHGKDVLDDGPSDGFSPRCTEATSGWTRRVRIGKAPVEREISAARKSALELSVRAYITKHDGNVANPVIGTSFDSIDEAYNFYNLYSWEVGFGIRLSKSRLNVNRSRCMQEIVCGCAGKPVKDNTRSSRCGCNAMIRLLRSEDNGCLGKVFSIVGSFFGCIENVPFTKRVLRTLCGKINKEQSDSDARKTMDILSVMKENDPAFNNTVQVDEESRIKILMWVNDQARSMELAIEAELPNTVHRWCKWHVLKKAKESMGALWGKNGDFKTEFHKLVHHMVTEEEFKGEWAAMLEKYSQKKHPFLQIYELDGGGNVLPVPHEASRCSSIATAIDEIADREQHVYIEEGTGDFYPMVAGVCCAEELVLDDGDNASGVGAVDDKADEDDADSRPTKRAKL